MALLEFPAWDPVILDLPGPLAVRWYGLMFLVAFGVGYFLLGRLARARLLPVEPEAVGDLLFHLMLGVILGGRLGYALFYDRELLHPVRIVQLWNGGLSFHGGLLGVLVATWVFARKQRVPMLRVADACALATPPGILAVRLANFINGELYGRVTTPGTFGAMRFPTDPVAMEALGIAGVGTKRDQELAIQVAFGHREWADVLPELSPTDSRGVGIAWERIRESLDWETAQEVVPFRHPSQLWEGLGEGLVLGILLWAVWLATRRRPFGAGFYGGLFLAGYGVVRFGIEYLRQPDRQFTGPDDPVGTVLLGMTMGQTLCAGMVLVGVVLMVLRRRRSAVAPPALDGVA